MFPTKLFYACADPEFFKRGGVESLNTKTLRQCNSCTIPSKVCIVQKLVTDHPLREERDVINRGFQTMVIDKKGKGVHTKTSNLNLWLNTGSSIFIHHDGIYSANFWGLLVRIGLYKSAHAMRYFCGTYLGTSP